MSNELTTTHPRDLRASVELAIADIEPDSELDSVCAAVMLLDSIKRWEKEQREILMERLLAFIRQHGPFEIGSTKYCIAKTKPDLKCRDVGETLQAVFRAAEIVDPETGEVGMDWSKVVSVLSSNAFRPAAASKLLADDAGKYFYRPEPADKVKAEEIVQIVDTNFLK